jgi:copper chaperone CopZ
LRFLIEQIIPIFTTISTTMATKIFFLAILAVAPCLSFGQFKSVEFGVDGLTCSACTRSVEMSIRKLDFVEHVEMNLSNTNGKIILRKGQLVSFDAVAKAVTDAGFSVRYLNATFWFDPTIIINNGCFTFENSNYQFISDTAKNIQGAIILKFIGKQFLPSKEFKKQWNKNTKTLCENSKLKTYYVKL